MDRAKPHIIVIGKGRKETPNTLLLAKPVFYLKKYQNEYHPILAMLKQFYSSVQKAEENVNKMLKSVRRAGAWQMQ